MDESDAGDGSVGYLRLVDRLFGIQEGDNFTVIYDQKYVDTVEIGHGTIWGAIRTRRKELLCDPVHAGRQSELLGRTGAEPA